MIITFLRSSSFGSYEMCPQQYFCEYNLGWTGPGNKAANKGTIVHKVLEVMALAKKGSQEGKKTIKDEICGTVKVDKYDIEVLLTKIYKYYSSNLLQHDWLPADFNDCVKWTHKALEFNEGQFDPRKKIIVDAEPYFDIEIQKPWAAYEYQIGDKKLSGFLRLKGTIDLIIKIDNNTLEVIDWKTGRYRKNWATGKEKDHESFRKDPQLRMYHYAAHHLYNVDQVLVTVYYINAGGPFTICFDKEELYKTEDMIQQKFEQIRDADKPILNKSWKCRKFCHHGKSDFGHTTIKPLQEFRWGQEQRKGELMSKCAQVEYETDRQGLHKVINKLSNPNHVIGHYQDPGAI